MVIPRRGLDTLGSVWQTLEQFQPLSEQVDRFDISAPPAGVLSRLLQIPHGFAIVSPLLKVYRQFGSNFSAPLAVGGLFPLADPLMESLPPSRRHPAIEHFLIQGMEETIPGRCRPVRPLTVPIRP